MANATTARRSPKLQVPSSKFQAASDAIGAWTLDLGTWNLVRATPLIEDGVDARDRGFLEARPIDAAVVFAVHGKVHAFGRFADRHLLIVQRLRLVPQVAQERLEVGDLILALERLAVAGDHRLEVERLQFLEIVRPLVVEAE